MMKGKKENNSGDNSTNVMDSENVTVDNSKTYGISYRDAKDIAMDVFTNNFYELSGEAAKTAIIRVEEFTEDLLKRIQEKEESLLNSFSNPDIQYGLFEAQKTVARKGNKHISNMLAELLIERAKVVDENLVQITLNEAIEVMGKLTKKQIDLLTLVFSSYYIRPLLLNYAGNVKEYFDSHFLNFFHDDFIMLNNSWDYQHFNYTGTAIFNDIAERNFAQDMLEKNDGFFTNGITANEAQKLLDEDPLILKFLIPHLFRGGRFMTVFAKSESIDGYKNKEEMPESTANSLRKIIQENIITVNEVPSFILSVSPSMSGFLQYIERNGLKNTSLTGVGIAIALTNLKFHGIDYQLEMWIN